MRFSDRAMRLRKIAGSNAQKAAFNLLVGGAIDEVDFANLSGAATYYVYVSLRHAFPAERFELRADLFDEYADQIRRLPNVTPNGLILPKRENFLAYHELHRAVADVLDRYDIGSQVEVIHHPVNIAGSAVR